MWKTAPAGTPTVVYSFASGTGNDCQSGLTLGTDGNFYGSGLSNCTGAGYIFKMTPAGVVTVLHTFTGQPDGYGPGILVQYTDGNFYGVTNKGGANNYGSVFKITPTGTLTTLYSFDNTNNFSGPTYGLTIGNDGNFYGTQVGGDGLGSVFKITPAGVLTMLHHFTGNPDGLGPASGVILGKDGNFYGVTQYGGTVGDGRVDQGTFFKMTSAGVVTILHSFNPATDYAVFPTTPLIQATDGNFYSTTNTCNEFLSCGSFVDIYKLTSTGTLTVVEKLTGPNGLGAYWALTQDTNGTLYGITQQGGTVNGGVFFSVNIGAAPFARLVSTSGKAGSKIGILGQGFSASSVVKFNGATATTVTRTGSTFLLATVPAGATNGFVTVTTGTTTLTSSKKFIVHDSWSAGAKMPTAVTHVAGNGTIGTKIYVVGGETSTAVITTNQVYNPSANTWTTAAPLPAATAFGASAVVGNILYVFGGTADLSTDLSAVWAYNPTTNSWTSKAAMPSPRRSASAVVASGLIYVMGGYHNGRIGDVDVYNPATNTWASKTSMPVGKSEVALGLSGTTIIAADGFTSSGDNGNNVAFSISGDSWSALTSDPTPRNEGCSGILLGHLYIAGGGENGTPLKLNESFNLAGDSWTTQASMPTATLSPGYAVSGGMLYCFGGSTVDSNFPPVLTNVQIYQP